MIAAINNHPDAEVSAERRTNSNGQAELVITVENKIAGRVRRGAGQLFKAMQRNYGLNVSPMNK